MDPHFGLSPEKLRNNVMRELGLLHLEDRGPDFNEATPGAEGLTSRELLEVRLALMSNARRFVLAATVNLLAFGLPDLTMDFNATFPMYLRDDSDFVLLPYAQHEKFDLSPVAESEAAMEHRAVANWSLRELPWGPLGDCKHTTHGVKSADRPDKVVTIEDRRMELHMRTSDQGGRVGRVR